MCNEMIDNYSGILFDKKYNKVIVERMSIESNIRKKSSRTYVSLTFIVK